ncbi:MAG: amidohydrolase family protein [Acidobacteria bacterium]|nr:amidohydrolase family protein [Acidobacteriota bacterium]
MKRIGFLSVLMLLIGLGGMAPPSAVGQNAADLAQKLERLRAYPDLIVVNGKISTINASNQEVQAIAVKNNRILALGTNDEVRFLAGPQTEVLDAKGRRVLPGLIDGHTHPHMWATAHRLGAEGDLTSKKYNDPQMKIVLAKGNDQAGVLRALERAVQQRTQELGPGKWILVAVYGGNSLPESRKIVWNMFPQRGGASGVLTQEFVDHLAPNNPLIIFGSEAIGGGTHNTKAKEEMLRLLGREIDSYTGATALVFDIFFRGRAADAADYLKRELLECVVSQGVTTYGNHYYSSPTIMKIHNLLYQRGELPVRWAWWVGGGGGNSRAQAMDPSFGQQYPYFFTDDLGDFRGIGNDFIWNAGVADEGFDGGLICTTAKPLKPFNPQDILGYGGLYGPRPDCATANINYEDQAGYRLAKAALEAGERIGFLHHYSDGSFDALFHMIEQAISAQKVSLDDVRALRISTEHTPIIRPDQIAKIAQYNIRPAFNGYQVQGEIKGGAFLKAYGEQFMTWMAPMKTLADAGVHPVFNTDAHLHKVPVEWKDMDYPPQWDGNIWGFIEFFVTRKMPHDGITYNRTEAMDRTSMMKAATIWGAEQLLNEKNIGSLEVGKLADFTVIDKDFFTIPEDQIRTIKTLLTAVGGKVVYKDPGY